MPDVLKNFANGNNDRISSESAVAMAVANGRAFFAKRPRIHQEMPAIIPCAVVVRYRAVCPRIIRVISLKRYGFQFLIIGNMKACHYLSHL